MTHLPPLIRSRRAVAALAIVAIAALIVAPDTIVRGLPFIVVLACPLMMVVMMGPMHRMPATSPAPREGDPYASEVLIRRLVELDAERAAITDLLAVRGVDRSADPPSRAAAGMTSAAHAKRT